MSIRDGLKSAILLYEKLKPLTIHGKIQWLFFVALIACLVVSIPLVYANSVFLSGKVDRKVTATIVRMVEKDLSKQLLAIDIAGINRTLLKISESVDWDAFCLLNKQKVTVKSKNKECDNIGYMEPILTSTQEVAGYLYVEKYGSDTDVTLPQLCVAIGLVSLFFGLAFLMMYKVKKTITKPLGELSASVTQFSKTNDFHIRVPLFGEDEIGRLASTFNRLLQDMRFKEHELIKAKNLADEANSLKGDFLASVSHEIRTPMNGIIGTAELLMDSLDSKRHKNYTNTILRSAESLLSIINDILDFSKIESGKLDIDSIPFNLYSEVEDVADLMAIKAVESNLEIIVAISPYVPEFVIGDPSRLRQVITNLMNNAIKFTREGHVLVEVESIGCQIGDQDKKIEEIRFSVVDTGIGITEEAQTKIFDRFTQAESSITREFGGTGLGLAICKQLVELQGGEIGLESTIDRGSNFHFSIEFDVDETQIGIDSTDVLENTSVVVIDDNPYFLEHIKLALRFYGVTVYCTNNAKDVFSLIDKKLEGGTPIDMVIVDENMSGVSGVHLCEKISLTYLESSPAIVILNEMDSDVRHEQVYSKVGINAHMQKPIRIRQLIELMDLTLTEHKEGNKALLSVDEIRSNSQNSIGSVKFANPHILIAELSDVHFSFMEKLLCASGCRVSRVLDGDSAIEFAMNNKLDLIILDMDLPLLDELGIAKSLKKVQGEMSGDVEVGNVGVEYGCFSSEVTPIIAVASSDTEQAQLKSIRCGLDAFLHKQSMKSQLLSKVAILIPNFIVNQKNGLVHFEGVKILLVEDNRVNIQIATEILQEFGCDVEVSHDGQDALEIYKKKRFDIVLMDCQMPIMNGFDSTKHIRHFEKLNSRENTPIIALTANAMKGDSERCYRAGMDDYITKPIKREKLRALLTKYVDSDKVCIKQESMNAKDSLLVHEDQFERMVSFSQRAGIDIHYYLSDVEKSIQLLIKQLGNQPPKIIYETAQAIIPVCEALAFNRIALLLARLAKSALSFHVEGISSTHILQSILDDSLNSVHQTRQYLLDHNVIALLKAESVIPDLAIAPGNQADNTDTEEMTLGLPVYFDEDRGGNDLKDIRGGDIDKPAGGVLHFTKSSSSLQAKKITNFNTKEDAGENKVKDLVDLTVFESTRAIFKSKFSNVLADYLEDCEEYLSGIASGIKTHDLNIIRENAHPLKSSSHTLGFSQIGNVAKNIEIQAKNEQSIDLILEDEIQLNIFYKETVVFIQKFLESPEVSLKYLESRNASQEGK